MSLAESMQKRAELFIQRYGAVREELSRVIVGHDDIIHGILTCLFVGGHALLEGVPGLGKTLLVRTLAKTLDLDFSRIQFTPDLMPADILGTNMVMESPDGRRFFEFQHGPIFTQICLADEINRATPKTQSAMLETMQEGSVSVGRARAPAQAAVLRDGHAKPDRAGRHLPAARGPARPLLVQAGCRLFQPRRAGDDHRPHDARRKVRADQGDGRRGDRRVARPDPRGDFGSARAGLRRAAGPGHASRRTVCAADDQSVSALGRPARAARKPWPWRPRCGRCSKGATTSASRTCGASICRRCGIA